MKKLTPVVWLCAAVLTGTGQPPKASTPSKAARAAGANATDAATDAQIEATIKAKLAKSKIGLDKFQVHVQGGVATWEGQTSVVQHKGTATRMAKTAGAKAVINNIQVSDEARAKAAGNLETGRRRVQVKRGDTRDQRDSSN
jgi:hypothetical protein